MTKFKPATYTMMCSTDAQSAASRDGKDKTVIGVARSAGSLEQIDIGVDIEAAESRPLSGPRALLYKAQALLGPGLEVRGVSPVPLEERVAARSNVFSIWFCISVSLLP